MKKKSPARVAQKVVIDAAKVEQGPPYCLLMLDEESVKCLALGAVNARCEVQAQKLVAALYGVKEP